MISVIFYKDYERLICSHEKNKIFENPRFTTVKLKNISKQEVSYLPSHFGLYLKKELKFSKNFFHSFIDLGLHFDLCENELGFFARKSLSKKPPIIYKFKMCHKVLSSIYILKQK